MQNTEQRHHESSAINTMTILPFTDFIILIESYMHRHAAI